MKYQIQITNKILKKLERVPGKDKERIIEAINSLAENPRPEGYRKLKDNHTPSRYRIRAGDYRIVYLIQDKVLLILVVEVGHRKYVYR